MGEHDGSGIGVGDGVIKSQQSAISSEPNKKGAALVAEKTEAFETQAAEVHVEEMPDRSFDKLSQKRWFEESVAWIKAQHDPRSGTQQLLHVFAKDKFKIVAEHAKKQVRERTDLRRKLMDRAREIFEDEEYELMKDAWAKANDVGSEEAKSTSPSSTPAPRRSSAHGTVAARRTLDVVLIEE